MQQSKSGRKISGDPFFHCYRDKNCLKDVNKQIYQVQKDQAVGESFFAPEDHAAPRGQRMQQSCLQKGIHVQILNSR